MCQLLLHCNVNALKDEKNNYRQPFCRKLIGIWALWGDTFKCIKSFSLIWFWLLSSLCFVWLSSSDHNTWTEELPSAKQNFSQGVRTISGHFKLQMFFFCCDGKTRHKHKNWLESQTTTFNYKDEHDSYICLCTYCHSFWFLEVSK